jgi:hypothetical protein
VTGTLPAELELAVDPDQVGSGAQGSLTVRRQLSLRTGDAATVPVHVFWITDQIWLPMVVKQAPDESAAMALVEPVASSEAEQLLVKVREQLTEWRALPKP